MRRHLCFLLFFSHLVGEIWTFVVTLNVDPITVLQFNSCKVNPHLTITSSKEVDLIIPLSVGSFKVPDHLKLSLYSFSSPPLDSQRTKQADVNKYIARREFKGGGMVFLLSPCQQRVNNGNIKMCRAAATHLYPSLPNRGIKAEREKLLIAVREGRFNAVL